MCGRYSLTVHSLIDVQLFFSIERMDDEMVRSWRPRYNIAPTQVVPVIWWDEATKSSILSPMKWGLVPSWVKTDEDAKSFSGRTINARIETVHEKPMYRSAFRARHCIVPMSGFYEWKAIDPKTKQPYYFTNGADPLGQALLGLAGIWEERAGSKSFSILTQEAKPWVTPYHDRMPVILGQERLGWLPTQGVDPATWSGWLAAHEQKNSLTVTPVSKAVNSPRNDSAECINPL